MSGSFCVKGFSSKAPELEQVMVVRFLSIGISKIGLAGFIVEGLLFGALGLDGFIVEARVFEKADFDRWS